MPSACVGDTSFHSCWNLVNLPIASVDDNSFHFMLESCELVLTLITKLITSYLTCQIEGLLRVRMLGHVFSVRGKVHSRPDFG
jgi:hypothetical protein